MVPRPVSSLGRAVACLSASALGVACNAVFGIGDHELEHDGGTLEDALRGDAPFDAKRPDATGPNDGGGPDRADLDASGDAETNSVLRPFASCTPGGPGRTTCGVDHDADCCASPIVEGGTYDRTYESADAAPVPRADPATVSDFRLDTFEVTVGRFRPFVAAWLGGFRPPPGSGKHTHLNGGRGVAVAGATGTFEPGWEASDVTQVNLTDLGCSSSSATWTSSPAGQENLPMNCVNRTEAYAFCIWDGGFLPTEAEWEYAAAGGVAQRRYPWGPTPPGTNSLFSNFDCLYPSPDGGGCEGLVNIEEVGMDPKGAGRWGQLDLAGNVAEWVLDAYGSYVNPCTDCAAFSSSADAGDGVTRGGSFFTIESTILPPARLPLPIVVEIYVGFRCARAP